MPRRTGVLEWLRVAHGTIEYGDYVYGALYAQVAELVDALASGASGGNPVEVQVLFSAPTT